jgi:hypothetical protein
VTTTSGRSSAIVSMATRSIGVKPKEKDLAIGGILLRRGPERLPKRVATWVAIRGVILRSTAYVPYVLTPKNIWRLCKTYGKLIGCPELKPHDLRH